MHKVIFKYIAIKPQIQCYIIKILKYFYKIFELNQENILELKAI